MSYGFQQYPDGSDMITILPSITGVQFQFVLAAQGTGKACVGASQNTLTNCGTDPNIDFNHAIYIQNLQAGTNYSALVTGYDQNGQLIAQSDPLSFATLPTDANFDQPLANPRRLALGAYAALGVKVINNGNPVAGATVIFSCNAGDGCLGASGTTGFTDTSYPIQTGGDGYAGAAFQAGNNKGPVKISLASPNTRNPGQIALSIG